jgi:cation diffusion facilitator CzcD-associated flavoprotein CzcO
VLFQPYPRNWPIYSPKDKIADWLEQYAKSQDLVVWTKTIFESSMKPKFDTSSQRWHLAVTREGKEVVLRPAHIVMATSVLGSPRFPIVKDQSMFSGEVYHASEFRGAKRHEGKRVLIVGVGNTAGDIAQDCVIQGAKQVVLLQRSSTCVTSQEALMEEMNAVFPEGEDPDVTDFKYHAMPIRLQRQWCIEDKEKREKRDEDFLRKLVDKGVKINQGRDGSGLYIQLYERWGGSLYFH